LYESATEEYQVGDKLYGLALIFYLIQVDHRIAAAAAYLLHQTPRNFKFISHTFSVSDKLDVIQFIQTFFLAYLHEAIPSQLELRAAIRSALGRTLQILYWDLGKRFGRILDGRDIAMYIHPEDRLTDTIHFR
jgi:hypothetical protein